MSEFHEGELAVQQLAGVRAEADRLAGMLAPPYLDGGPARFLGERTFAALTGHDPKGGCGPHRWSARRASSTPPRRPYGSTRCRYRAILCGTWPRARRSA